MSSWFTQSASVEEYVAPKKSSTQTGEFKDWDYFLKKGESSDVTWLDADDSPIPTIDYHQVFLDGKYHKVGCLKPVGKPCKFCNFTDNQPKEKKWKTRVKKAHCFSILDERGRRDESGNLYPPKRIPRFSTEPDRKEVQKLRNSITNADKGFLKDIKSLQYTTVTVSRDADDDKSPTIGKLGQVVGPANMENIADASPLSQEEILSYFVTDEAEIDRIAVALNMDAEDGPQING